MTLLEARGLACTFPNGTRAVRCFDLRIGAGELVGLIGPDGAGKSTVFRMLIGLQRPSGGEIHRIVDPGKVGYLPQSFSLAPDLSVRENLELQAGLFGIPSPARRIAELLETIGLAEFRERAAGDLSGGMKQKLSLCSALLPDPQLLLLDEPTTGVDPVSRREFWDLLHEVHDQGVAIFFSTPYMDEAEFAHRMLLMEAGRILAEGDLADFRGRMPGTVLKVSASRRREIQSRLAGLAPLDLFGEGHQIRIRFQEENPEPLLREIRGWDGVDSVEVSEASLEDFFLHRLAETEAEEQAHA
jgi:ABC-2 type transport system ATP-binding protein